MSALRASASRGVSSEILLTCAMLLVTVVATVLYFATAVPNIVADVRHNDVLLLGRLLLFLGIVVFLIYGNALFQMTRLGYLQRLLRHTPASPVQVRSRFQDQSAPPVTILIPAYKEDPAVIRKTLLSAALQQYPNRRVVLLIDDPPNPTDDSSRYSLEAARNLPDNVVQWLGIPRSQAEDALMQFSARLRAGAIDVASEADKIARLRQDIAGWFDNAAKQYPVADHADAFFVKHVLSASRDEYRHEVQQPSTPEQVESEYRYLVALLRLEITTFERKQYENLSHDPSKAANLNSYLALIGKGVRVVTDAHARLLEVANPGQEAIAIPDAAYIITLDADSLVSPDYAPRLIHYLEQPEHERVGVVQTPYSSFPDAPGVLERVAGATTDIQYLIHQGFTRYGASFWVGANAVLRKQALDDICTVEYVDGTCTPKYIQDRTVIEDTESTVDLITRGWTLVNYPERLAFSATPPDFGSLLIQRRRWANGGLIILPKLLRYFWTGPRKHTRITETLVRFHYLSSISGVSVGLLLLLFFPFGKQVLNWWLPLTAVPYFYLYGRDLVQTGYRRIDLVRVYAFNLLLVPVQLAGVAKSIHQAATGKKTAFKRTPKVTGRTAAPAWCILAIYGAGAYCLWSGLWDMIGGNPAQALFSWINAIFLIYAAVRFIGWRASRADILAAYDAHLRPHLSPRGRCGLSSGSDGANA